MWIWLRVREEAWKKVGEDVADGSWQVEETLGKDGQGASGMMSGWKFGRLGDGWQN